MVKHFLFFYSFFFPFFFFLQKYTLAAAQPPPVWLLFWEQTIRQNKQPRGRRVKEGEWRKLSVLTRREKLWRFVALWETFGHNLLFLSRRLRVCLYLMGRAMRLAPTFPQTISQKLYLAGFCFWFFLGFFKSTKSRFSCTETAAPYDIREGLFSETWS